MANVYYSGEEFSSESVLVEESVVETILRLDEVYWGLRKSTKAQLRAAFRWLSTRCDFPRKRVLKKTEYDRNTLRGGKSKKTGAQLRDNEAKSLTGESFLCGSMVLLNTVMRRPGIRPGFTKGLQEHFLYNAPGPKGVRFGRGSEDILKTGMYCCQPHTIPYQHALFCAYPDLYRSQERKFITHLRNWRERGGGIRWYRCPFYQTVLVLHDIGTTAARKELHEVATRIKPGIATKWKGSDRASAARALAADLLLEYR